MKTAAKTTAANTSTTKAAESYIINAIKNKDLSKVPLHPDVIFQGPFHDKPIQGIKVLQEYLESLYPIIKDARLKRHVANGNEVCTEWELETSQPAAVIPILEYFRVSEGQLVEIRPYYDPRPVTGAGK
jgi:hypothetical protein